MEVAARKILLLAGRLSVRGEGGRIGLLAERLTGLGLGIEVLCVAAGGSAGTIPGLVECPGLAVRWRRGRSLRRLVAGEGPARPDLIHVLQAEMADTGLALAERWEVPYVLAVDEFLPPGGRLRVGRDRCRALIAPGRTLADDLIRHAGVPAALIATIPPGIALPDPPIVPDGAVRVAVIGTAGPLVGGAGLTTFLEAARRVVDSDIDAEFVIAGQGPGEADLRRQAERLRLAERVTFAPHPLPEAPFWEVLDAYCQTSLVPTIGPTLGTALAHGVPAIVSDVDGLRTWVPEGGGRLVPPGDPEALALAVLDLLDDPEAARAMGRRGQAWIALRFDPDVEARALADLYGRVLDQADLPADPALVPPPQAAPDRASGRPGEPHRAP